MFDFRTLFVLLIAGAFLFYAVRAPFYTLLFYLWLSYFRPETWVWSPVIQSLNFQLLVGAWLVLFALVSAQRLRFGIGPLLLLLLLAQGVVSTTQSLEFEYAWRYWQEFAKSLLIGYLMLVLITTEQRLRLALIVMAVSLGFEGAKQGWAQLILNPGARNDNTFALLGDNNGVAIGMVMLLSLFVGLIRTSSRAVERHIGRFLAVGVTYRAISTYSRGGFLSCAGLILHYVLRSRRKVVSLLAVGAVAAVVLPVLPTAFWERMSTIQQAAEGDVYVDGSAAGRIHYWRVAVLMANDRPLVGVGQNAFNVVYDRYDPSRGAYGNRRSVHSQWFGMLAELGYPGLILFIALLGRAFFVCWRTRRLAREHPQLANLAHYATAIEGALVAAVIGGTFYPFHYNEMLWHTIALSMVVGQLAAAQVAVPHTPAVREGVALPLARSSA
jgi:probable O-glycosylation ligase (exosortase A-associated)